MEGEQQRGTVVVVGAGFAGLALACRLLRARRRVVVLERRGELPSTGAAVAIQPNGLGALDRLGLLARALGAGSRIDRIAMCAGGARAAAVVDYRELKHPHPFVLIVRRAELLALLAAEVERLGGELRYRAEMTAVVGDGDSVRGARYRSQGEDREIAAWCLAGADGINSRVRTGLAIPVREWGHEQRYVVGVGERPEGLADGTALVYHGSGFSDGVMPLGEHAYFYDTVTAENEGAVDQQDLAGWRAAYGARVPHAHELTARFSSWHELSVLEARPSRAARRTANGAALLGDAAATVHPHSAQGANLALEDGVALGESLEALCSHRPLQAADLAGYERVRGAKAARYVAWSRFAGASFDGATVAWRSARMLGWQWMRLPPARRALLRQGAGLA